MLARPGRLGLLALLLAACGDGSAAAPDGGAGPTDVLDGPGDGATTALPELVASIGEATSGTRLEAQVWEPADGAPRFRRWYDRQRNEPCSFILAADRTMRCLPISSVAYPGGRGVFADERCEVPALRRPATACPIDPPGYLRPGVWLGGCRHGARIHRPRPLATGYALTPDDGKCVPLPPAPGETLYGLGEELPITDFVAAQDIVEAAVGGVAPVIRQGEDGSRSFLRWRDTHGQACSLQVTAAGPRCLPTLPGGSFEPLVRPAPDCTGQSLRFNKANCPELDEPAHATQTVVQGCGILAIPHRILESIPATYQAASDGTCQMREASIVELAFRTESTDPAAFPSMQLGIDGRPGRLRPLLHATAAGVATAGGYLDTRLSLACSPGIAEDGVMRCLPVLPLPGPYFADPACSDTPLWSFPDLACRSDLVALPSSTRCPPSTTVLRLEAAPHEGPVYVRPATGGCQPLTPGQPGSPTGKTFFYKAGARVPATDLAEIREPS